MRSGKSVTRTATLAARLQNTSRQEVDECKLIEHQVIHLSLRLLATQCIQGGLTRLVPSITRANGMSGRWATQAVCSNQCMSMSRSRRNSTLQLAAAAIAMAGMIPAMANYSSSRGAPCAQAAGRGGMRCYMTACRIQDASGCHQRSTKAHQARHSQQGAPRG